MPVWGSSVSQFYKNKLHVVQNKIIRTIFAYDYYQLNLNTSDIIRKYNILDIEKLLRFACATLMYKIDHKLIKTNHRIIRNNEHGYMTRNREHPRPNHFRTEIGKLNVCRTCTIMYNNLNNSLRTETNPRKFKQQLKRMLLNQIY